MGRIPTANRAEATLIAGAGNEFAENIVCGVPLRPAFVDGIDHKVGGRHRREWKYFSHCSKADFRMNADITLSQTRKGIDSAVEAQLK
jgi:hypothetical protein